MLQFRDGQFKNPMASLGYNNVTAMCRSSQGSVLAAAMEHGAITYRQGRFEMLASATALPRSPIISMAQTPSGEIWVGTRDAGLFRLDSNRSAAITKGLPDPKVNCLLPEGDRGLWVGTDNGIVRWNGNEISDAGIGRALDRTQVLAMARDRDGNLWLGTDSRGLLRLNTHGVVPLDVEGAGSGEAITAVFEDREGNLWTGSAGGIERLRDSVFDTYSVNEGLPSKSNGPVYADAQNRTWFAPVEGGLYWLGREKTGQVTVGGLAGDVVYSIAGRGEELWLGPQHGGLTVVHSAASSPTSKTYTQADGLAENSVYAVHQNRDGTVWAGTLTGGASKLQAGRFTTYTTASGLASNTVSSILEAADGSMWFATPNGLSVFSGARWQTYTTQNGLPANDVNCILEDSSGLLWIGTGHGLASRTLAGFRVASGGPESLRQPILGIAEDKTGSLWIATSNHVLRVRRAALVVGTLHEGDVREYRPADGLRGVEGVKRHRSVVADPAGRIWFSLNRGLSVGAAALVAIGFEVMLPSLFAVTIGAAIGCIGPGAFSIDARMFGRREIIIPHIPRPKQDCPTLTPSSYRKSTTSRDVIPRPIDHSKS